MEHSIEMTSIDDRIPFLPRTEKDEIEEGRKLDYLIDIKDTNGQDPSGSQTKKSLNQIFAKKFRDLDNSSIKSFTIFKVNVWLRESKPDAYTPKIVSIGPYHRKNPELGRMEKYKLLYLRRFLQRKEGLDVESCISELEELKEITIKCYEDIKDLNEFCQMLLLDGCFVVEFIRERYKIREEDWIINFNGCHVFRDLMLLENQLPFFVLNHLHDMTKRDDEYPLAMLVGILFPLFADLPRMTRESFIETGGCDNIKHLLHLVHRLSCHGNLKKKSENNDEETGGCCSIKHLLHLVHRLSCHGNRKKKSENNDEETGGCYSIKHLLHLVQRPSCHGNRKKKSENNDVPICHMVMPNATELSEAGVSFAKGSVTTSLFDIKFDKGWMTIPCFRVQDGTETLLRNLIGYEQQSVDVQPKYFSDFSTFMDDLIESDKDVNFLRQKGIIVNWIGEDKEVANLFNKIGIGVSVGSNFYYKEECRRADEHCKKGWNKMMASLKRNYFSSPWVGASTVAAIILLILTTIQTILAFTGSIK